VIIDDEASGGAWSMESMDGCFVDGVVCCIVRHGCGAAVRSVSVKFVAFGVLSFCGVMWRFVAFCGFLAIWVVPGKSFL
jgi:hypothetical protein